VRTQEVLFNVLQQSWFYDVPEGRPDASPTPTVTVILNMTSDNVGTVEVATTGAVVLDTVNTTLTSSAAIGDQALALTSSTGMARRRSYLLSNVNGDTEWVEPMTVAAGGCGLRRPLINAYPAGSTLVGTRIAIGVNPAWVIDQSKISDVLATTWRTSRESSHEWGAGYAGYRLRWSYSFAGSPTIGVSYGDLVRYVAKNLITPIEVDTRIPGWIDRLPNDYRQDQGVSLIDDAFYAIKLDAIADDQVLRRIRNTEILHELTLYRANLMAVEANVMAGAASAAQLVEAQKLYTQRYDQLMREPKFQVDQIGDGSAGAANRLPIWRR